MRIAILLSGETRTWRRCASSHITLFPGHEVDFFLQAWHSAPEEELSAAYAPRKIKIEEPKRISETVTARMIAGRDVPVGPKNHTRARAMIYQWRGVRSVWLMIEGLRYDAVIRLRYDLLFREPLPGLLDDLGENDCRVPLWRDKDTGPNDHLAVMGPRAAEAYCGGMEAFLADRLNKSRKVHPFQFTKNLEEHMTQQGVTIESRPIPYLLVRPEYAEIEGYGEMAKRIFQNNEGATFGSLVKLNHPPWRK